MSTVSQSSSNKTKKYKKINFHSTPRLSNCPFAKGLVVSVCMMNPKKPNSAMRHVAKVKLYSKPSVTASIPGQGFGVSKFNSVLVSGGRANDLPGVGYSLVSGVYDFSPLMTKKKSRSYYGVPRKEEDKFYMSKKTSKKMLK